MCGIAGFISNRIPESTGMQVLQQLTGIIKHRGPDDAGHFMHLPFAIGMRRLSIIDLANGAQPIFNENRTLAIVFNGEIYNYRELRDELFMLGHAFHTVSDTEVILKAFEQWGTDCFIRLNGMFAVAILDVPGQKLYLSRDRYGIKPLFYYWDNTDFVFGSELSVIEKFPELNLQINPIALNYYLTMERVPAPMGIYTHVHKLMPGHFMVWHEGKVNTSPYYKLSFSPKMVETREEFYIKRLEELLEAAVKRHMISDVPLGAFLSGGVDSSLISYFMQKNAALPVKTFSIGFEDKSFDESEYSGYMAKFLGTEHHHITFSRAEMVAQVAQVTGMLDEPFADSSLMPTHFLSFHTRRHVKVALSGDGSDELFGGYPTYKAHKLALPIPGFTGHLFNPLVQMLPVSDKNMSFDFKLKKFVAGLHHSPDLRHIYWLGAFSHKQRNSILTQFGTKQDPLIGFVENYMKNCDTEAGWERALWSDMRYYLQDNMFVKVDRASMANSLEVRVPFLDTELAEFALRIPANLKMKGLTTKYILKQLAIKHLPDKIVNRPKKGFGIPIGSWIKGELKEIFMDTLNEDTLNKQGIFNGTAVKKIMNDHMSNKVDNRKLIWTLYVFQQWYNKRQPNTNNPK